MIIGIYLDTTGVTLKEADDIEVVLWTNTTDEQVLHKPSLVEGVNGEYYVKAGQMRFCSGILYCKFRTVKDGVVSAWHQKHLGFLQ
jgi:hypothetical protein